MKARVDPAKCEGYGPCNQLLPEVFKLDEWGYAFVEGDGEVPADKEDEAHEAVASCPVHAVSVSD